MSIIYRVTSNYIFKQQVNRNKMKIPKIYQVILRIAVVFAITETLIMLGFVFIFTNYSPIIEAFIDVSLLTIIATPLVYLTVIKPYITTIHQLVKSITQDASTDYLTQLANRRAFEDHLKRLISYSQRHGIYNAILYIDLDNFKAINDIYGHAAGDYVLITTANRLKKLVRQEDLICRAGGDEFIISLTAIADSTKLAIKFGKSIAKSLLESLSTPIQYENNVLSVGSSIGLRIVTPISATVEKILSEADSAMYEAKHSAQKIIVFDSPQSHD